MQDPGSRSGPEGGNERERERRRFGNRVTQQKIAKSQWSWMNKTRMVRQWRLPVFLVAECGNGGGPDDKCVVVVSRRVEVYVGLVFFFFSFIRCTDRAVSRPRVVTMSGIGDARLATPKSSYYQNRGRRTATGWQTDRQAWPRATIHCCCCMHNSEQLAGDPFSGTAWEPELSDFPTLTQQVFACSVSFRSRRSTAGQRALPFYVPSPLTVLRSSQTTRHPAW